MRRISILLNLTAGRRRLSCMVVSTWPAGLRRSSALTVNPLTWLHGLFSLDIGIDLGTSNTRVYVRGKGIVVNEPSWVAVERATNRLLVVGTEAKKMLSRTPRNVAVIRPVRHGVISDFESTTDMLEYFFGRAHEASYSAIPRPRVVVGVPAGATVPISLP